MSANKGIEGRHKVSDWLVAVRPWSFPASAMPVIVSLAYLWWAGRDVSWANGLWALANIVLFHASGNAWSDYFDYKRGVDAKDTFGSKTLCEGLFTPRQILRLSLCLLAVAVVAGIGLCLRTGMLTLVFGLLGGLCSLLYPPLKYRALGDVVIFVAYALLPTLGTSFVATGVVDWGVLWIAPPIGLITVAILHANNTRDMRTDGRASIRTLAMALGARGSVVVYCLEILLPFVWIALCAIWGVFPLWTLAMALALISAVGNVRMAVSFGRGGERAIARLDEKTAQLQIQFSLLFAVSLFVATLL